MTRPDFERSMAALRERIAELPAEQRAELERLADETVARDSDIRRNSLQAHRALERLELSWERLQDACTRLDRVTADARDAMERLRTRGVRPAPGVN